MVSSYPTSGGPGKAEISISVEDNDNDSYDERSVAITINAGKTKKTLMVAQKQKNALLISSERREVKQEGGTIDVEVEANVEYKAIIADDCQSWIKSAASTTTRGLKASTISFKIEMNQERNVKEKYISLIGAGVTVGMNPFNLSNIDGEVYSTKIESFTHKRVYDVIISKKYLSSKDHVLIIDDFLANGCALNGLLDIAQKAGATVEGVGIAVEKGFQRGGELIRQKGIRVESVQLYSFSCMAVRPVKDHVRMIVRFPCFFLSVPYVCAFILMGVDLEGVHSKAFFQFFGQVLKLLDCGFLADYYYPFPDWGAVLLNPCPVASLSPLCPMYFGNGTFYPLFVAVCEFRTDVVELLLLRLSPAAYIAGFHSDTCLVH